MILGKGISETAQSVCWAGSGQDGAVQGQLSGLMPPSWCSQSCKCSCPSPPAFTLYRGMIANCYSVLSISFPDEKNFKRGHGSMAQFDPKGNIQITE